MIILDTPFPKNLHHTSNKMYAGMNWRERKRIKDDYLWWFKTIKLSVGKGEITAPSDLFFEFTFRNRAYDCSNCSMMGKILEDCLVKKKIFKDDSIKYIKSVKYISKKGTTNHLTIYRYDSCI